MRNKLIDIIDSFRELDPPHDGRTWTEHLADHLLSEGVIVPPVKVGQTVYCIRYDKARKPYVKPLVVLSVTIWGKGKITLFTTREDTLGATAFLTREEAEKAVERSENGT